MLGMLRLLIVVQLVAGAALVTTIEPEETGVETAASTTTTAGAPAPSPAPTPTTTATTAPKATTTTAAAPTLKPVPAGKYAYRLHETADGETNTYKGTWSYFAARQTDGELRQLLVDENESVEGATTTVSLAWRSDGRYTRSFEEKSEEYEASCNFEPDVLEAPSPMVVGKQWTTKTACPDHEPPLNLEGTSKVVRADRITIGGKPLAVYVIEVRGRVVVEGVVAELHSVAWFSVDLGFAVREETTYSVDGEGSDKDVLELVSTTPTQLS